MDSATGIPIPVHEYLAKKKGVMKPASQVELARRREPAVYSCDVCNRRFKSVSMLNIHKERVGFNIIHSFCNF